MGGRGRVMHHGCPPVMCIVALVYLFPLFPNSESLLPV
jgi:hypothetical protein